MGHLKCEFATGLRFVESVDWICGVCWKDSSTFQAFHFIWGYFEVIFRVFSLIYVKKNAFCLTQGDSEGVKLFFDWQIS